MAAVWDLNGQLAKEPPGVYLCTSDRAPLERVQWVSQPDPSFSGAALASLSERQRQHRDDPNRQAVRSRGGCVRVADRPRDLMELRVEGRTGTPFYVVDNKSDGLTPEDAPPVTLCDLFWTDGCRFSAPFYGRTRFREQARGLHSIEKGGPTRFVCTDDRGVAVKRAGEGKQQQQQPKSDAAAEKAGTEEAGEKAEAAPEPVNGRCAAIGPRDEIVGAEGARFEAVEVVDRGQTNQPPPAAWVCPPRGRLSFYRRCVQAVGGGGGGVRK